MFCNALLNSKDRRVGRIDFEDMEIALALRSLIQEINQDMAYFLAKMPGRVAVKATLLGGASPVNTVCRRGDLVEKYLGLCQGIDANALQSIDWALVNA